MRLELSKKGLVRKNKVRSHWYVDSIKNCEGITYSEAKQKREVLPVAY